MKKVAIFLSSLLSVSAFALDGAVNISSCPVTKVVVGNVDDAAGWGGHFSTGSREDGYGGYYAECHLTGAEEGLGNGSVTILCQDGYASSSDHVDVYSVALGARNTVEQVEFTITERGVAFEAIKHSTSGYTNDENPYVITGFFPMGEAAGFCRENTLYYQANGVLANRSGRGGDNYSMSVTTID